MAVKVSGCFVLVGPRQGNAEELFMFASEPAEARRRQRLVSLCA